jgi:hypothetical protein
VIAFHRVYGTATVGGGTQRLRAVWSSLWRTALIGAIYWLFLIFAILTILIPFLIGLEDPGS